MANDSSRTFFEMQMHRHLRMELPEEALQEEVVSKDLVGRPNASFYGTRDAVANSQMEVKKFMEEASH